MLIKTPWGRPSASCHATNRTSAAQWSFITHLRTVGSRTWQSRDLFQTVLWVLKVMWPTLVSHGPIAPGFHGVAPGPTSLQSCWWCRQLLTCCHSAVCSLLLPLLLKSQWSSSLCIQPPAAQLFPPWNNINLQFMGVSRDKHSDV